ncbi:hypothetical protein QJS04_geneDACA011687 [Acorus gramineus]|uniref:Glycosyl transferase family 1 domain-containing protein n=1 Tax=Acorus gramineus TaxID=55184 RepID=A0AAV9BGY2_ACOGR|nr:hypothetical protein QJS04_geneDACA011687 [Acorus gramineus]
MQNLKSTTFLVSAILIVLLSISLNYYTNTIHHFKHYHPFKQTLQNAFPRLFRPTSVKSPSPTTHPPCVLWMAPFISGGGYSSEAWSYITALTRHANDTIRLAIEQHGDLESLEFWLGLSEEHRAMAQELHSRECGTSGDTVVVCHSEPGAWYPPLFMTRPCPPGGYDGNAVVIGRTMFETDRVAPEHVRRCNRMDSVWVPTDFHMSSFVRSGVEPLKVVKVVQSVDVEFFDPVKYQPFDLPMGKLVLGGRQNSNSGAPAPGRKDFAFLSIFKWEQRKGWDVLLKAYLNEFSASDRVSLYLLTNPYHSDKDFTSKISQFVTDSDVVDDNGEWAEVYVIDEHVPQVDLPRLYRVADAFVLPSRGEGWGRPIVEAMAMALPVIATNWSGPTEYLNEENGYPLMVERMVEIAEGPFVGHFQAEPSVEGLRGLMRRVWRDRDEAAARGRRAREDVVRRFSPEVMARVVVGELMEALRQKKEGLYT